MRLALAIAISFVSATALAQPVAPPPKPTPAEKAELDQLQAGLREFQSRQAFVPAARLAKKRYELERKVYGDAAPQTRGARQELAGVLQASGDDAGANAIYREMLAEAERDHGPNSREVFQTLPMVTSYYMAEGRYDLVDPYDQRAIAIAKQLFGEHANEYAGQLLGYGALLNIRGEYASATRLYEQAIAIYRANAKSPEDLSLLGPTQGLGMMYWFSNQQAKAQSLFERAIAIAAAAGKTMPGTAGVSMLGGTMWGIASVYQSGGRTDLAKPLVARVMQLFKDEIARVEQQNPSDPQLSSMYGQLASNLRASGDMTGAEQMFGKAMAADQKAGRTAAWGASLADVERALGRPRDALALLERQAADLAKLSPKYAHAYDPTIADVLRELGEYPRAKQLLLAYRESMGKLYGTRHPTYGMAELALANVFMATGEVPEAAKALADELDIAERELTNILKIGTESDHEIYFARYGYVLDVAVNFAARYGASSAQLRRLGLETVLRRKGRVLDAAAATLATIRAKLSPDDKLLLDQLAAARGQLAKLTVAGPSATGTDDYAKSVAALEDQVAKLEIAVGQKSAQYRAVSQPIALAAVQRLVPAAARLVEVINYQPYDPKQPYRPTQVLEPRRYGAFVLAASGDPAFVDLGPAQPIDDAINAFRKAVANPNNTHAGELGHALYALTIGKLVPQLGGATEILIAPDGALNLVPFSALVDDGGKVLLERYNFTYLTSGRDLLRLAVRSKAQGGGVMFANPSFDAAAAGAGSASDGSRGARSADLASLMWPQLPGTGQEADEVEKTWTGFDDYRGERATETAVKAVHGPKILHLATHGFFLADEPPKGDARGAAAPATAAMMAMPQVTTQNASENPLLRSGLALAGANQLKSGEDDGILTALEASGLDLWGTQLVVLSACDTGNGKVTNGDGVYGLRRALVIAGAESLVMSLWQVDDAATRDLMAGYYARLKAGRPRSTALRDVQIALHGNPKYAHPFYWAAFLAAGDNTPLQ